MDTKLVESVMAEVGKAFRLCRFYPATHPSVQQAMTDLSACLPTLSAVGTLELRIGPAGFALGTTPLLARNPPVQEFANLLYAQGHRAMTLEPGDTADEFAALIRSAAGATARAAAALGAVGKAPPLPHIRLEGMVRKSAATPRPSLSGLAASSGEMAAVPVRSSGVFRPNALPPEIEAHRLAAQLEVAIPSGAIASIVRLGTVAVELSVQRDFGTFAEAVAALGRWTKSEDAAVAEAAAQALAPVVNDGTIAGIVGLMADRRAAPGIKLAAAAALGALGERAVPALFDAYVAAPDDVARAAYADAVQAAGVAAVRHLASRAAGEQVEPLRAAATLLGGSGSADAVPVLAPLARHGDAGVRRAAVGSLARLGGGEAGRMAMAALRDRDPGVRLEAARGLAHLSDRGFGPIVLGRLAEEADETVGLALIEVLGRLQEPRAVPALADLARETSGVFQRRPVAVRVAAIRALVRIGTADALAVVASYRSDRHPEVRAAVDLTAR